MNALEINNNVFENIKHIDEDGKEYWLARELMPIFGYIKWQKFNEVINKAINTCDGSNNIVSDHFTGSGKMFDIGSKTTRIIANIKVSNNLIFYKKLINNLKVNRIILLNEFL